MSNTKERVFPYVFAAISYLETNRIPHVRLIRRESSDYYFGGTLPVRCDRLELEFVPSDTVIVHCQIVFDSMDYTFPPDIILYSTTVTCEPCSWLISRVHWDITDKKCLYNWVKYILLSLKEKTASNIVDSGGVPTPLPQRSSEVGETSRETSIHEYRHMERDEESQFDELESDADGCDNAMQTDVFPRNQDEMDRIEDNDTLQQNVYRYGVVGINEEDLAAADEETFSMTPDTMIDELDESFEKMQDTAHADNDNNFIREPFKETHHRSSPHHSHVDIFENEHGDRDQTPSKRVSPESHDNTLHQSKKANTKSLPSPNLIASTLQEKSVEEWDNPHNLSKRRDFITAWLVRYPDCLIQVDTEHFSTLSLFLNVAIPNSLWNKMTPYLEQASKAFPAESIANAQPVAPVIAKFSLHASFPSPAVVQICLISVFNMESDDSYGPAVREISHPLTPESSTEEMVDDTWKLLSLEIPKFHSQLFDL